MGGGSQNFFAYFENGAREAESPNGITPRERGRRRRGVSVVAILGPSFRGKAAIHFAQKGGRANSEHYLKMI